jgi:hypothetical protein
MELRPNAISSQEVIQASFCLNVLACSFLDAALRAATICSLAIE